MTTSAHRIEFNGSGQRAVKTAPNLPKVLLIRRDGYAA